MGSENRKANRLAADFKLVFRTPVFVASSCECDGNNFYMDPTNRKTNRLVADLSRYSEPPTLATVPAVATELIGRQSAELRVGARDEFGLREQERRFFKQLSVD
jgi:hypothetical protein